MPPIPTPPCPSPGSPRSTAPAPGELPSGHPRFARALAATGPGPASDRRAIFGGAGGHGRAAARPHRIGLCQGRGNRLYPAAAKPRSIMGMIGRLAAASPSGGAARGRRDRRTRRGDRTGRRDRPRQPDRAGSGDRAGGSHRPGSRDRRERHHHPCPDRQPGGASIPASRLGQDGFGFVPGAAGHIKIAQIGRVIIQDDVEIGANTTIDRGSNRDTVIGEGTKIDNQVQIGHNVGHRPTLPDRRASRDLGQRNHRRLRHARRTRGNSRQCDHRNRGPGRRGCCGCWHPTSRPASAGRHACADRWRQWLGELKRAEAARPAAEGECARAAREAPVRWMSRPDLRPSTSGGFYKLLPHRYPFLMVDRIIDVDGDKSGGRDQERHRQRAVFPRPFSRASRSCRACF